MKTAGRHARDRADGYRTVPPQCGQALLISLNRIFTFSPPSTDERVFKRTVIKQRLCIHDKSVKSTDGVCD